MPQQKRKLAAIMFTDIVGYTESMSIDEQAAIQAVRKKRSIIQPLIKEHSGVFVKEIGDGTLSYFVSVIDASTCAVKLQTLTFDDKFLNIRIGIHVGDIVFDGEDVFGEGVNIASRLEELTKSYTSELVISKYVAEQANLNLDGFDSDLVNIRGRKENLEIFSIKNASEIRQ